MERKPLIARFKPFYKELKSGQSVSWCSCGRSKRQPYCDGRSHLGTGFEPLVYRAERDEEVLLCGCKHSRTAPFCDGAHSNLGGYNEAQDQTGNASVELVTPDSKGSRGSMAAVM